VDAVHIHVGGVRLVDRAREIVRPQDRQQAQRVGLGNLFEGLREGLAVGQRPLDRGILLGIADEDDAARAEEAVPVEERLAGDGQDADDAVAVVLGVERGRATGGVVAGGVLALQHHDAAVGGEFAAGRGAGDAAADDDEIGIHGEIGVHGRGT
jgi:hypothetical protein